MKIECGLCPVWRVTFQKRFLTHPTDTISTLVSGPTIGGLQQIREAIEATLSCQEMFVCIVSAEFMGNSLLAMP